MNRRIIVVFTYLMIAFTGIAFSEGAPIPPDKGLNYPNYMAKPGDLVVSRADYADRFEGFWLGQCIANWTGLRTEGCRNKAPYFTDDDWGTEISSRLNPKQKRMIEFVLEENDNPWKSDDDTNIEYIYQETLLANKTSILTPQQIKDGWCKHIFRKKGIWVSNKRAKELMEMGMLPPETSLPENNKHYDQIDAQLTTEIFGLFAPTRPDVALKMAHLPIRTTAYKDAEWIAEFYVIMHSLAAKVDPSMSMKEKTRWLAAQARQHLPEHSYAAKMYDFVKKDYENNPDIDNWEKTRDALHDRYFVKKTDGYQFKMWFDAGINFGASLVSLFYGEGDYKRTVRIGSLCGWDSDNPTATWGGLLGFMLGRKEVEKAFPDKKLSGLYDIAYTRINFPDRTPNQPGDDSFEQMAQRGIHVIDRVVIEEMGGGVDLKKDLWYIPNLGSVFDRAKYPKKKPQPLAK